MLAMKIIFLNTSLFSQGSAYSFGIMGLKDPFFFFSVDPCCRLWNNHFMVLRKKRTRDASMGRFYFFLNDLKKFLEN